jgi:hypothetical protein
MAEILLVRASLAGALGQFEGYACTVASRGLSIAFNPMIRKAIQEFIDQVCADSQDDQGTPSPGQQ